MTHKVAAALDRYPEYEATIGIEVHVQLKTNSKIFCSCPNQFGDTPNKNICVVCTGQPGTLPVLNRKVVDSAIMAGLATNCKISKVTEFARKHYMYPDSPKNYQITQSDRPICKQGFVPIRLEDGSIKHIALERIHLEEDAGKNIHATDTESFVDLNRAGTPLIEVVSAPDIANAYEANAYLQGLRLIVQYLGISDANMEEGSFRADVNISVKKKSAKELGTRIELKNINSFKFIGQAIEYEIERQISTLEEGGVLHQETRLWDTKLQQTAFMRSKEVAQDYRYFVDPDLPLLMIDDEWIARMRSLLPELPFAKFERFKNEYGLTAYEADILVSNNVLAAFYEAVVNRSHLPKQAANWILRDLLGFMNERKIDFENLKVTPDMLGELLIEIDKGVINNKTAQDVFIEMAEVGKYPSIIIQEKDLKQIGSEAELEAIARDIIEKNPTIVADYKAGNERVFAFLVGQTMKATKGKGNPKVLQDLLKKHLL